MLLSPSLGLNVEVLGLPFMTGLSIPHTWVSSDETLPGLGQRGLPSDRLLRCRKGRKMAREGKPVLFRIQFLEVQAGM